MAGIIISMVIGLLLGYVTDKPYILIAAGMIAAYVVQRFINKSDKQVESKKTKTESN